MKKKIIYFLSLVLIFIYYSDTTVYADESWPSFPSNCSGMASESAAVVDCHSHTLLVGKNEDEELYPASITKIMTTLLALEKDPSMSKDVTVSDEAMQICIANDGSNICGKTSQRTFNMREALEAVMYHSANEMAQAVGESIAGSNEDFAKMMTQRAKQLGCEHTNFLNANGFHDNDHYTSAYDMCLISSAALEIPAFRDIAANPKDKVAGVKVDFWHNMAKDTSTYPYCIGGKTGLTNSARYTLATFGEQDNMRIACVIMKDPNHHDFASTDKLMRYSFDNFKSVQISKEDNKNISKQTEAVINKFADRFSKDSSATITYDQNATATLPSNADFSDAKIELDVNESAQIHPGKNTIGELCYTYSDRTVCKTPLYLIYNENSLGNLLSTDNSTNSSMLLINNSSSSITNIQSIIIDSLLIGFILSIVLILIIITKNIIKNRIQRF